MKLCFFLVFIPFSCQIFCQNLSVENIRALNLINDKGNEASYEDELILIFASYSMQQDSLINWSNSKILSLNDTLQIENLDLSLPLYNLGQKDLILILLVQRKSKNTAQQISQGIKKSYSEYANFPRNLVVEKIRYALEEDILLHAKFYSLAELQKLKKLYLIKGTILLNKYEYEIGFNF